MVTNYPIKQLIEYQCSQLNINIKELITRIGYSNITVGLKRLHQLFEADFQSSRGLIQQLPNALKLDKSEIEQAIQDTKLVLKFRAQHEYRSNFKPNFIVSTANCGIPKQIFVAAILNSNQYIASQYPEHLEVNEYVEYALTFFEKNKYQILNFYNEPKNIVINYSPDKADVISLQGDLIEHLDQSVINGQLSIHFR